MIEIVLIDVPLLVDVRAQVIYAIKSICTKSS